MQRGREMERGEQMVFDRRGGLSSSCQGPGGIGLFTVCVC